NRIGWSPMAAASRARCGKQRARAAPSTQSRKSRWGGPCRAGARALQSQRSEPGERFLRPSKPFSGVLPMLRSFAALGIVAAATVPLAAQYSTGFETVVASPGGTAMAGQDGFFVPPVTGSIDGAAYTYAGNTLGIPVNPNGGANFWAGVSIGT